MVVHGVVNSLCPTDLLCLAATLLLLPTTYNVTIMLIVVLILIGMESSRPCMISIVVIDGNG